MVGFPLKKDVQFVMYVCTVVGNWLIAEPMDPNGRAANHERRSDCALGSLVA